MTGVRLGAGTAWRFPWIWVRSCFPTPGTGLRVAIGWVVKNGWANRSGSLPRFMLFFCISLPPLGEISGCSSESRRKSRKDLAESMTIACVTRSLNSGILRGVCQIEIVSEHDHRTFGSCDPTTRIVHIKKAIDEAKENQSPLNETQEKNRRRIAGTKVTLYKSRGKPARHS